MLIIDGHEQKIQFNDFENLENLLDEAMKFEGLNERIVTDVLVNNEHFSEIYPHQAEDIEMDSVDKVEIISVPQKTMIQDILGELNKVTTLMEKSSQRIAELFRQADDGDALEMYYDLLEVVRNFLAMISLLHDHKNIAFGQDGSLVLEKFSSLLGEIIEVQENQDWILMADLLEYEFNPIMQEWKNFIDNMTN